MTTLSADIAKINTDAEVLHDIVHGPSGTTVTTESGECPTVAEALARASGGNVRGAWTPDTLYAVNDVVTNSGTGYRAIIGHISSASFATDAANWIVQTAALNVTNSQLANMATQTIKGRATAGTGQPEDLTAAQVAGIISPNILCGYKNLLINARGTINQRGYVSGAATSGPNQYTLDRWRVVTSGQSLSFTASGNTMEITAPVGGVEQVVEGEAIAGGSHVINWSGTATCTVNGTARAKGESFTLTAGANCTVRFSGGTFKNPQLEYGTIATPFEQRPIGLEEMLCQRYYEKSYSYDTAPGTATYTGSTYKYGDGLANSVHQGDAVERFKVAKRAPPSCQTYSPITGAAGKVRDLANGSDITPTIDLISTGSFRWYALQAGASTVNSWHAHWAADAEL